MQAEQAARVQALQKGAQSWHTFTFAAPPARPEPAVSSTSPLVAPVPAAQGKALQVKPPVPSKA